MKKPFFLNSNHFFTSLKNRKLLMIGFLVAVLSIIGGFTVRLVFADSIWRDPTVDPPGGMPSGPVYLQTGGSASYTFQNGGIKINQALINSIALGGSGIDPDWYITAPNAVIKTDLSALGTTIKNGFITTDVGLLIKSLSADSADSIENGLHFQSSDGIHQSIFNAGAQTENISYTLPLSAPSATQILTSNDSGQLSWSDWSALAPSSCGSGQVLKWNGSAWACGDDNLGGGGGSGDITDVLIIPDKGLSVIDSGGPQPKLAIQDCASGQILKYLDDKWQCAADDIGSAPPAYTAPRVVGATPDAYDGFVGGYSNANGRCSAVFADSHICTTNEVLDTINHLPTTGNLSGPNIPSDRDGYYWVSGGIPFPSFEATSNDCQGWTSNDPYYGGVVWYIPASGSARAEGGFHIAAVFDMTLRTYVDLCESKNKFLCCK